MFGFWHILLAVEQVKLKFCKGRLRCLASLVNVSLTLALMRLFPSLLRWLICLLDIHRVKESLDWLEMIFELLTERSCSSVKLREIRFIGFFQSIVQDKSLL
jgi:hypothetical protein